MKFFILVVLIDWKININNKFEVFKVMQVAITNQICHQSTIVSPF